jgi:integrase
LTVSLKGRDREPYNARHSSVTWNLMTGKNPLWVAKQHSHSVQTMLEVYAAWTEGAKDLDIAAIREAMITRPTTPEMAMGATEQAVSGLSPAKCQGRLKV